MLLGKGIYTFPPSFLRKAQASKKLTIVTHLLEITYPSTVTKGNFWLFFHLSPGRKHSFREISHCPFLLIHFCSSYKINSALNPTPLLNSFLWSWATMPSFIWNSKDRSKVAHPTRKAAFHYISAISSQALQNI